MIWLVRGGVFGRQCLTFPSQFQAGLREVAKELKQLRRALVVVGGFAEMWNRDRVWDDHVHTVRHMFAHEDVLTITGAPFYRTVQSCLNSQKQAFY